MELRTYSSLQEIPAADWNRLQSGSFPFSEHAYLLTLETSGSVGEGSGWSPSYLTLWNKETLIAATYLYLKTNSYGEYIFDWEWAHAYQRHGLAYYPKLLSAVPFTPATGPKLLIHPEADAQQAAGALIAHARELMESRQYSGLHFLFIPASEIPYFERAGFFIRHSFQFHWQNAGYGSFDEFLASLKRKRRAEIQRERRAVAALPLSIERLTGEAIQPEHIEAMYDFYSSTIDKKEAIPYLTRTFFRQVYERMRANLLLVMAKADGEWVAGAIYCQKGDCLYGRYWGCKSHYPNLHFELCYYQGIEHAIQNKLRLFEAGAQGSHKMLRGFNPQLTYSAHWIVHPEFREAIGQFIEEEKKRLGVELGDLHGFFP